MHQREREEDQRFPEEKQNDIATGQIFALERGEKRMVPANRSRRGKEAYISPPDRKGGRNQVVPLRVKKETKWGR